MNLVIVNKTSSFNIILNSELLITGLPEAIHEEVSNNMWCVGLSLGFEKKVTLNQLEYFFERLLVVRKKQLLRDGIVSPVTFYLWHDELAGQLRFNFISGHCEKLPFGCTVIPVLTVKEILQDFLSSPYLQGIPLNEFEVIDINEESEDEEDEVINFELKVFKRYL
ncbi:MAG TPA: hypothetical protein VHA52_02510 [Candidatus Babeliaceae bacterium]|nr:hypothetical protein [Candidatus Babeliaceae bacterium]